VVLLDFWASWCGPCRASNKELVKLYSKYKDKGFQILGVSLDDDKAAWKKAVAADKITWLQVNANGGWESPSLLKWEISALPTSFLIDKNGTLLAMDLEGKELEKALKHLIDK
jgi:thiol-disulfide isomerase/thioredoxin